MAGQELTAMMNMRPVSNRHSTDVLPLKVLDLEYGIPRPEHTEHMEEDQNATHLHTDDSNDAHCTIDSYQSIDPTWANEWRLPDPGPYLQYVQRLSSETPRLIYLAHWMEVTTSPLKWADLREHPTSRAERAQRVGACVMDYSSGQLLRKVMYRSVTSLRLAIQDDAKQQAECQLRIIVLEDLSRDLIEFLGGQFDVDPRFFREFLNDYFFNPARERWADVPPLLVETRARPFWTFSFLRARYYSTEEEYTKAERQSGTFNVLRRLDSDRSRKRLQKGLLEQAGASVALGRSKVAIWTKAACTHHPAVAILLTDPTVTTGNPIWGGIETGPNVLSMSTTSKDGDAPQADHGSSLFDSVVRVSSRLSPADLAQIAHDVGRVGIPMSRIALKEWLMVIQYMNARLRLLRWKMEKPNWGENSDDMAELLYALSPWQSNLKHYEGIVKNVMQRLFPRGGSSSNMAHATNVDGATGYEELEADFLRVAERLRETHDGIKAIAASMLSFTTREDSRRTIEAMKQNRGLAFLSILATIFLPLNFVASFFSMSENFSIESNTCWLFFAVSVPLAVVVGVTVGLSQHGFREELRKMWRCF